MTTQTEVDFDIADDICKTVLAAKRAGWDKEMLIGTTEVAWERTGDG